MTRLLPTFAILVALQATASAQAANPNNLSIASVDPDDAVAPVSAVEGPGIKIGEGTVLHPVFGVEGGYVSNVFYTNTDPQGTGLLRLLAQIGTGSLPPQRLNTMDADRQDLGALQYRADLRASYDFMLSGNSTIRDTGGLGLGASLHALANPSGRWSFGIDEDYQRLLRAANYETNANATRDINTLALTLLYHPQDRTVGGYLYFDNTFDVFERSQQDFADRTLNRLGVHPTWRWLPQTQIYADISEGIVTGLGNPATPTEQKVTSYPFTALLGIATLFTVKTTFNLFGGYTNGFYSTGANFSAPTLGAVLGYRYSPLGRAQLMYSLQYQDSINANYYRDHVIQFQLQHLVAPFVVMLQPEVHFREYDGITLVAGPSTRDDLIFNVIAGMQYNFRDWFAATLNYRFTDQSTDYRYTNPGATGLTDPSYIRHEILLGIRIAM